MQNNAGVPQKKRTNQKFKPEEDQYLRKLVKQFGLFAWEEIANLMGTRNARQCHDRWHYYLSPRINNEPWTEEDDRRLIKECYEMNGKWVKIAKKFKGRTDTQIKNRWNILKKNLGLPDIRSHRSSQPSSDNSSNEVSEVSETSSPAEAPHVEESKVESILYDKFISLFNDEGINTYDSMFDFLI